MAPQPKLNTVTAFSTRLALLEARTELERQAPGYSVFVWFADKISKINSSPIVCQDRFEVTNPLPLPPRTWHYEFAILDQPGSFNKVNNWEGSKESDSVAYSDGFNWQGNDLYLPPRPESITKGKTDVDPVAWMTALRRTMAGTTLLTALTIPGTHNSFATPGSVQVPDPWLDRSARLGECQGATIHSQLLMGIRFFDFRTDGMDLNLRHGRVGLNGKLSPCLDQIKTFLDNNPGETVVVSIKRDNQNYFTGTNYPETAETRQAIEKCFDQYGDKTYTSAAIPTLDQCRGKMVLLWGSEATKGMQTEPRPGAPEVSYESDDYEQHFKDIQARAAFNEQHPPTEGDHFYYDVWTNAYFSPAKKWIDGTYKCAKDHADYSNSRISDMVLKNFWQRPVRFGVFAVDFAYPFLTKVLILTNFHST